MTDREILRAEHNKRVTSGEYKEKLGCTCVNCGSTERIEYHHIVPLCMGGTNRLTNIVPVCVNCHVAIHGEQEYRKLAFRRSVRKPKPKFEEFEKVFWDYANCKIDTSDVKRLLGMSPKTSLNAKKEYQMFLYRNNITKIVNHVGKYRKDENWPPERRTSVVGYTIYKDHTKEIHAEDIFDHYGEVERPVSKIETERQRLIASMEWE